MRKQLLSVLILAALLLAVIPTGHAQGPVTPPDPPDLLRTCGPEGPCKADDGHWYMPEGAQPAGGTHAMSPQETGGPDDFGYTWDDSVAFNWVDTTTGIGTGLEGDDEYTDPIAIGFDFKFYENTYSQLYITTNGLVTFDEGAYDFSNQRIPNPASPNNFIAPFWDDLCVNYGNYNTGNVYYKRGGNAPNRYFAVGWHQVSRLGSTDQLTFQVILYENGDIVMQYLSLSGNFQWATVGIEDDMGVTGLQYLYNASGLGNNQAIRFYRPGPIARVKVWPLYQGHFVHAGETATFEIPIHNTGELGADTYDVTISSTWPVSLYQADGVTPLTDTDGDGVVDTGSVAQGATATIVAEVTTPHAVGAGDANQATLTVQSSLDPGRRKTVALQTGVPTSFAQVYRDNADGAMSLYLAQPGGQSLKKTTGDYHYGYDMAVAEMPNSFAYVWRKGRSVNNLYVGEIEYTLLDSDGNTTRGVTKLTDHSGATVRTYDYDPAVAVAPNGRIGVLWYRYRYNSSNYNYNYNVFFAILDSAGNRVYGPLNLTNNNVWGDYDDYGVPRFYEPRIAATDDNRFVLAWRRYSRESAGSLSNVYYAVRDTNGGAVKGVTNFTNGVAGDDYYYDPALARLNGNRALLAYYANGSISYAVLDSAGNAVKGETSTGGYGYRPDAVQLADGTVLLAWTSGDEIEFAVLDGTNYNIVSGPTALSNPAAVTGDDYVSVTADGAGRGILTWMDADYSYRRNLYYALVDSEGSVLTDPMIFRTSQATDPNIDTSYEGYGNTSWSGDFTPPTNPTSLSSASHITATWSNDNTVEVTWSGATDADSGVDGYSVLWDNNPATVPDATKEVGESTQNLTSDPLDDGDWYFHIRAVDGAGNWATGAVHVGPFKIDTTPPESKADAPEFTAEAPVVSWSGTDEGSGIDSYDVQVRDGAGDTWTGWLTDTMAISATYTAVESGHTYYFRSVAYDHAGNVETDLPEDGDTHTTVADYQVEGRVTNNRGQPVFNATVSAQPDALNTATTDTAGDYALYFESGGTYTLTVSRSGFGALPPLYDVLVDEHLTGVDLVLPPQDEAVSNGGWETGDLDDWNSGPSVTSTVAMTAAHTGRYGVDLNASGGTLAFWPYVTQTVSVADDWSQPTLSFLYRAVQGEEGDALQAVVVGANERLTHTVALSPVIGAWTHAWCNLSAFSGQTVTLRLGFQDQTPDQQVYLDEVSVGESEAGVVSVYLPLVMRNR